MRTERSLHEDERLRMRVPLPKSQRCARFKRRRLGQPCSEPVRRRMWSEIVMASARKATWIARRASAASGLSALILIGAGPHGICLTAARRGDRSATSFVQLAMNCRGLRRRCAWWAADGSTPAEGTKRSVSPAARSRSCAARSPCRSADIPAHRSHCTLAPRSDRDYSRDRRLPAHRG
jgi:hypothetical protein